MGALKTFRAPGRVNLIGDHTDYNDGFVLPFAIDLACTVRGRASADATVRLTSRELDGEVEIPADGSAGPREVQPPWGRYVAGVVHSLAERGRAPVGFEGEISSDVPVGSGLSSSAAFEVSLALALADAAGLSLTPQELARVCQAADHAMGVPSGIMDQLTSISGRRGYVLLIDCRSLDIRPIPFPDELAAVVVHSGLPRALADSAYAARRAECEAVAARLGLPALRDASLDQVHDEPRARHVVSENARVLAAADALVSGDVAEVARLMSESHVSLRDDYEVSTPELDLLVASLEAAGATGARLTGAGFGGCVVALAPRTSAESVAADAARRYREQTGLEPRTWICRPAIGAGPQ